MRYIIHMSWKNKKTTGVLALYRLQAGVLFSIGFTGAYQEYGRWNGDDEFHPRKPEEGEAFHRFGCF